MSNEQAAPEAKGVTVELLAAVDLGPEIEGMAGRQLRMRMVTIEPGGVFGPIHDHKDRPGTVYILQGSTYCKERSLTIKMESLRTMGREWAGPRIGTPHTGLRTGERFRRWRSRSI
jgi:hypothetical protein